MKNTDLNKKCRKMQLTINNPQKEVTTINGKGLNNVEDVKNYMDGTGLIKEDYYCFSFEKGLKEETPHLHIFFCFNNAKIGTTIKKHFPTAHIEFCRGSNIENRDYVFKSGKWEGNEKEGTRIEGMQYENRKIPEEKGQGKRSDLEYVKELIEQGKTPKDILDCNPNFYPMETYINKMFYNKRLDETPFQRTVKTIVHTGVTGSGKTYFATKLSREETYVGTDYSNGCTALLDGYTAQKNLFLDEFRGQIPYNMLLTMLNGYTHDVHARYNNKYMLWDTVHITSLIPMEQWYNPENIRDTYEQLQRRVDEVVFHFMSYNGIYISDKIKFLRMYGKQAEKDIQYHTYTIDGFEYTTYEDLEKKALSACNIMLPHSETWEELAIPTLEEEFNKWKENNNPFNVLDEEQLFNMFWAEKIKRAKAA